MEEVRKIRVKTGITLEVNDAGETIVVSVEDQNFIDKFYDLMEDLQKISEYADSKEFKALEERDQHKEMIKKTEEIMEDIDTLFGERACEKVFGDIVPSAYVLADFMYQLEPYTREYADERQKIIASRYNKSRRGNSKHNKTKDELIQEARKKNE